MNGSARAGTSLPMQAQQQRSPPLQKRSCPLVSQAAYRRRQPPLLLRKQELPKDPCRRCIPKPRQAGASVPPLSAKSCRAYLKQGENSFLLLHVVITLISVNRSVTLQRISVFLLKVLRQYIRQIVKQYMLCNNNYLIPAFMQSSPPGIIVFSPRTMQAMSKSL